MKFALIDAEKTHHPVSVLARVLGVSREGYYAWRRRGGQSARVADDQTLTTKITAVHAASRATYGAPRVHPDLAAAGVRTSRKRVARLMRQAGLQGVHRRPPATRPGRTRLRPPHRTGSGRPASPTSRRGRAGCTSRSSSTCTPARSSDGPCPTSRRPRSSPTPSPWPSSTAGPPPASFTIPPKAPKAAQYTSDAYHRVLKRHGARPSFGATGVCWDNSAAESFFGTLKNELVYRETLSPAAPRVPRLPSTSRSSTTDSDSTPRSTTAPQNTSSAYTTQTRPRRRKQHKAGIILLRRCPRNGQHLTRYSSATWAGSGFDSQGGFRSMRLRFTQYKSPSGRCAGSVRMPVDHPRTHSQFFILLC
ncbi:transposase [Parafrankia sp. Ea1.12]|nr:transposase [Parafrankia sp. Ea1.12]